MCRPKVGTAPRPRRSSGTKASPSALRATTDVPPIGVSPMRMLSAGARVSSPEIRAINSPWPLPDTPAMPTISPLRTTSDSACNALPVRSSGCIDKSRTTSMSAPASRAAPVARGGSAPIIRRDRLATVSARGSHTPVSLPPRSTVAREHSERTSSSLWLMYRMATPSEASLRSVPNSFSTACGVSTEVGSSMISSCGFCSRQRMISTRWRSPTDSAYTGCAGSTGNP